MSNKVSGLLVVLEEDIKEEAFKDIKNALLLIKGVVDVSPVGGGSYSEICATNRERADMKKRLLDFALTL